MVRLLSVAFSSVSVFFSVHATGPANTISAGQVCILKAQGFNEQTVDLADKAEAHSDDEVAEGDSGSELTYHIKIKDGRSMKVKSFFRMLDSQHRRLDRSQAKRRNCR